MRVTIVYGEASVSCGSEPGDNNTQASHRADGVHIRKGQMHVVFTESEWNGIICQMLLPVQPQSPTRQAPVTFGAGA